MAEKQPDHNQEESHQTLLEQLEQTRNWDGRKMCLFKGFWFPVNAFHAVLSCRKNFKARDNDVILATMPRSGTVWLKALTFTIANRRRFTIETSPLLHNSPHLLVPFLEFQVFMENENPNLETDIPNTANNLFSTHMPRQALPDSVFASKGCKVIYICRNPLDQFISYRHFLLQNHKPEPGHDAAPLVIDRALEMFLEGVHLFGPFWDHVLGYWSTSQESPEKVLFLKYEDLKEDCAANIKKIAEFIGSPFSEDEEKQGVIGEIEKFCSFGSLKNLEKAILEKNPDQPGLRKGVYRKGEVGDWMNYMSEDMAERVRKLTEEKLSGSGLTFKTVKQ